VRKLGSSVPRNGELVYCLRGDEEEPLEPPDSVLVSKAEKVLQAWPEGRLEVVDVGEKGDNGLYGCVSGINSDGGSFESC